MSSSENKCEQIDPCLNIVVDYDQPLRNSDLYNKVCSILGEGCSIKTFKNSCKYIEYKTTKSKPVALLLKAITYLGYPHLIYKKRIQIPSWWKIFYDTYSSVYDVRFVGVYHYDGLVVFSDFDTTKYVHGKAHNSSAHVYINDIFQAISYGVFKKVDSKDNIIKSISSRYFKNYLDGKMTQAHDEREEIFNVFRGFNREFCFNTTIKADNCIIEMKNNNWSKWREAEWAGWFLEYKVHKYLNENNVTGIVMYVGKSTNLDLFFPCAKFWGDLKASDIVQTEVPGNDKSTVLDLINKDGKVWYIIYEHDTWYDRNFEGNPMTIFWNKLLGKDNLHSYVSRMKNSVNFRKMCIYEINRANMNSVLRDFNQGRQQSGDERNVKIKISKKESENFIIFRG